MKKLFLSLILALSVSSAALACDHTIEVTNAWARPTMSGKNMSAAFFTLTNTGDSTRTLTGVSVKDAVGEVHNTVEEDGVWKMRHMDSLDIAAGESATFAPKGMHVMLMQQKKALAEGESTLLTLHFADGESMTVTVPVQKAAP